MECGLDVLGNPAAHCKPSSMHLSALSNPGANGLADQSWRDFNNPQHYRSPDFKRLKPLTYALSKRKTECSHLSHGFPLHKPTMFQHRLTFYFQVLFDKVWWLLYVNSSIIGYMYNLTLV